MKYVVFECTHKDKPGLTFGITFPDVLTHKDVAEMIEHVKVQPDGPFAGWWMWPKAIRAGFVNTNGACVGYSESLGLKSDPSDTAILALPAPKMGAA